MKVACLLAAGLAVASSAAVRADVDPVINDVKALNYALQLEHLEAAFYTRGLQQFNSGFPSGVRDYLQLVRAHEQAHVSILSNALTASVSEGGYNQTSASPACSAYSFSDTGFADVNTFLSTAITLEDIGVSAYVAALNHLTNTDVQEVAATIATVEARHAAFLRNAVGTSAASTNVPFPNATNPARLPAEVLPLAASFLTNCTYDISANVPTVRPSGTAGTSVANAVASSATPATNPAPSYTQTEFNQDITVLRYALTLEYLEADFYQSFNGRFTADQFAAVSTVGSGNGANVVSNINLVRAHENAHVQALQSLLQSRGADIPQPGCYNWTSITSAQQFLQVAATLENTGVSAYDGAANLITDTGLQQVAAAVAVVEARHAAYLNNLNGEPATDENNEFGGVLDVSLNQTEILAAVSQALANYLTGPINNCANNRQNAGSNASFIIFDSSSSGGNNNNNGGSSSSSTGGNGNIDTGAASTFAVPAFATAVLAFASALLF